MKPLCLKGAGRSSRRRDCMLLDDDKKKRERTGRSDRSRGASMVVVVAFAIPYIGTQ